MIYIPGYFVQDIEHHGELATGASASNKRHRSSHGQETVSNEECIKHLQAEIDRLKAESEKGRNSPRKQHYRE